MKRMNKDIILIVIISLIYISKLWIFGFYAFKYIDLVLLILTITLVVLYFFNTFKIKSKIYPTIISIFLVIILVSFALYGHTVGVKKGNGYLNEEMFLPWNIVNEFDKGRNSKVVDSENINILDCKEFPREYINNDIIEGDNYYVNIEINFCGGSSVSYTKDNSIVATTDSYDINEKSDIQLEFANNYDRIISTVTTFESNIYSISKVRSSEMGIYEINVHNDKGEFIKGTEYESREYSQLRFATFSNNKKLYIAGNIWDTDI